MVTIITGLPLDNPSTLSGPMQVGHGVMFGRVWNGEEVPESTPSDQTAAFFLFHHPFPSPSTTCPRVWEVRPSSVCPPPNSTGSLAGRCTCQCGHQECSGLLQAVEGDWLRPTPRPCSGLTPHLSCPPWQPGPPPVVTPPHADSRMYTGRKPSCTQAAGRAQEPAGRVGSPCFQDNVRKARKVLGAGEACGPLASLPVSAPLLSPGAGGRHGCLRFIGVVPGLLRGRDSRRGPSSSIKP